MNRYYFIAVLRGLALCFILVSIVNSLPGKTDCDRKTVGDVVTIGDKCL